MKPLSRSFIVIALSLAATTLLLAQTPKINVQLGDWEITMTSKVTGDLPGMPDMSKLTPAQQAQVAAAMQGVMGTHTQTQHSCITQEDLDQAKFLDTDPSDTNCTHAFTTNTSTTMEGSVKCTGDNPRTEHIKIVAASPTTFTGTVDGTQTEQGKTMSMNISMSGKWAGATCQPDSTRMGGGAVPGQRATRPTGK